MRPIGLAVLLSLAAAAEAAPPPLPEAAEGWRIERIAETPPSFLPASLAAVPDGPLFIGGRRTTGAVPHGVVLRFDDGASSTFAEGLNPVVGLERAGDTLYVLHPPLLSPLRDDDGDGRAEIGPPIVSGLAPTPGAGGVRRGMDGFLYLAVGAGGKLRAGGDGGPEIRTTTGGIARVRPDGSGLEVLSSGDAATSAPILSAGDDVFALSGSDDPRWGLRLIQHVPGGRYGHPREFVAAEFRTLPPVAKLEGRSAGQGASYDEGRLPDAFAGDLVSCEPDAQAVHRHEIRKAGGGFALERRTPLATRGGLAEFRPIAVAPAADGFHLLDEGSSGFGAGASGRLYRLVYEGPDPKAETPRPGGGPIAADVAALDHPARSVRLEAQDRLAKAGEAATPALVARLEAEGPISGRQHAIWALDAIGGDAARRAIRGRLLDTAAPVRLQAARSVGIRRDREAAEAATKLLADRDPAVRREAAAALGRLGDGSAGPALFDALGDADRFAAWSIRRAILDIGCDDPAAATAALLDPRRREAALLLADESWSTPLVDALVAALPKTPEPAVRGRILSCLAGQFRRYPDGVDPGSGPAAKKTEAWDPEGMAAVLRGLDAGLKDADASVRYQAVFGLQSVGLAAGPSLREALPRETDVDNQAALVEALGSLNDATSTRLLLPIVVDPKRPESVRSAALDSLNLLKGRDVVRARLTVLYEEDAPESLVAKALPALARDGFLPPNDLVGFLYHRSPLVRAAAVMSLNPSKPLPPDVKREVVAKLDDEDSDVRRAAYLAAGPLRLREAVPKLVARASEVQDGDRTAVLNALCAMPDPSALPLYVAALDDPDPSLRRGSVRALLAIRDQSAADVIRIAAEPGRSPRAALALERVLARLEPVRGWRALGPLPAHPAPFVNPDGSIDAGRDHPGVGGGSVRWAGAAESAEGIVDLGACRPEAPADGPPVADMSAAAYAEVASASARRAIVVVEADGPTELYVNGVPAAAPGWSAEEPSDHFAVDLIPGTNRLVVLGRPGASAWRFVVSVSAADATPR